MLSYTAGSARLMMHYMNLNAFISKTTKDGKTDIKIKFSHLSNNV